MSSLVLKEKDRFTDSSAAYTLKRLGGYAHLLGANAAFLAGVAVGKRPRVAFHVPHELDAAFFGANCPPSLDLELEDLMFEALGEIGLRGVRVDWGYESDAEAVSRWLDRLIAAGFDVLLHLIQPAPEASRMTQPQAQRRWSEFVAPIFRQYGGKVRQFEIGSAPNRHSWSGYTLHDYVAACCLAQESAAGTGAEILGPNVSDFAPYHTIGLLSACQRAGVRFAAMTNNLFVDRAGAPESYDPSVAGDWLKDWARADLTRKGCMLKSIASSFGIDRVYSTYSYYTINIRNEPRKSFKRPHRHISPDAYADFLVRYYVLSAASGALDRVYWGNLAGHFKGVLDDGYAHRPDPPTVHHKYYQYGKAQDYQRRPAFRAFQCLVERLQGARFQAAISNRDPFVFQFERAGKPMLVAWSARGQETLPQDVRDWLASGAEVFSRDGEPVAHKDFGHLGPTPVYIVGR